LIEILKNKNLTTRFQILAEIANSGPNIQQKDIAEKLDITPQAVSDYIGQLFAENMLISQGRSSYRITRDGVNWIIRMLRELAGYNDYVRKAINNISVCTAIAESDLSRDQKVGLKMSNGMLIASPDSSLPATGTTVTSARAGEDIGITGIEGIVPLDSGKATVLRVPGIQRGGSQQVDSRMVKKYADDSSFIGAIGLESFAVLNKLGIGYQKYGIVEGAIEAVRSGLNTLVLCVEDETSNILSRLEQEDIPCELVDAESA
jgi:putative transcriptional regulator